MKSWIETLTGSLEQKKQYRQAVARMDALPEPYRRTAKAYQRYLLQSAGYVDGDTLVTMFSDFADLWERAVADQTPVRGVVGEDPAGFADEFAAAYTGRQWLDKERERLSAVVAEAEREQSR
ncbi:DUF1048 domain-containing protein [Desertihabitans brevis]|nr:DUF1048 domain-containing protein [Desertihabitans brevis]